MWTKCIYHSLEWQVRVSTGWITWTVTDEGIALMYYEPVRERMMW